MPGQCVQRHCQYHQKLDQRARSNRLSGLDAHEIEGNDDNGADGNGSESPETDAPDIQVFYFLQVLLVLFLGVCDLIVNPFVEPGHFVLHQVIEEVLQKSQFSFSEFDVVEKLGLHLFGHLYDFGHDDQSQNQPEKEGVRQLDEQVHAHTHYVQRLEDYSQEGSMVVVDIDGHFA